MDIKDTAEIFNEFGGLVIAATKPISKDILALKIGEAVLKNPKIKVKKEKENNVLAIGTMYKYTIEIDRGQEE